MVADEENLSERTPQGSVLQSPDERDTEQSSVGSPAEGDRVGGDAYQADGTARGADGADESGRYDELDSLCLLYTSNLQVIKSSEDNLVEGVKFHLYGTSLAGIAVDEYAVTDKNGVATFKDVLISGSTPYTLEEVDTEIRYVVPEKQTAPIKWNEVTNRDFTNILKKFSVTVTKSCLLYTSRCA